MNAVYVRQSVDKADSVSIESQTEHCMYEVKKEQYRVYSDKGYSGKNTERPEFQLMLEHIKQGLVKRVIVYKLDRISRSVLDFSRTMETFKVYDVEFVSVNEKFDTSTPMGRAMLNICIVFAELERETIQLRVADAYASRSRMGFYMGGRVPYGFRREQITINGVNTSQYVPVAEEIEHIQAIYRIYSKPATSVSEVVRHFRSKSIEKLRGVEWSVPRIGEVMRNPIYVKADIDIYNFYHSRGAEIVNPPESFLGENGCYLYTKDVNKMGTHKKMTQYDNMILVIAPHKGVVDSDAWIKCRMKADKNTQITNAKKQIKTWLAGKLKCSKCGYALRYNKWTGKTTVNEYFLCSEVSGNQRCTGFGVVKKEYIESEMLKLIEAKVAQVKVEQSRPSAEQTGINALSAAVAAKEQEIDAMLNTFKGGGEAVMRRLNTRVDALEEDILGLKNEILGLEMSKSNRTQLLPDAISEIFKKWDKVPIEERQAIADILINRVLVTKGALEVEWKT